MKLGRSFIGHGVDAVADPLRRAVADRDAESGQRRTGLQLAVRQFAGKVDVPEAAGALRGDAAERPALEVARRVDDQRGRQEQVVVGFVEAGTVTS